MPKPTKYWFKAFSTLDFGGTSEEVFKIMKEKEKHLPPSAERVRWDFEDGVAVLSCKVFRGEE